MMSKNYVFLADGFEEVEALTIVDVLRRAGMPVTTVSIMTGKQVVGAHDVTVVADTIYGDNDYSDAGWLILPGGIPGAPNLAAHESLCGLLESHEERGGGVAAICASPAVVLGPLGMLSGRDAVCYPGMEDTVEGVNWKQAPVAVDGNVVTGNGPAAAAAFALTIVARGKGRDVAAQVATGMLLPSDLIA